MRINRTDILGRRSPAGEGDKNAKKAKGKGAKALTAADATMLAAKPALVRKAKDAPEVRAELVAEARRLIEAGELDTPQAAKAAAEAIITRGL